MKYFYSILFLLCTGIYSIKAQDVIEEVTGPVQETRTLSENVVNIKTFQNVNVSLTQAETSSIVVEVGHVDLFPKVKTVIEGNTLVVSVDEIYYTNQLYEQPVKITVNMKNIESVTVNSKSKVHLISDLTAGVLQLNTHAGGELIVEQGIVADVLQLSATVESHMSNKKPAVANTCNVTVGTGAKINMNLDIATNLECYITNQSTLELKGKAESVLVTCQDKSVVKMKDFVSEFANAFATTESYIQIMPKNTLTATATYKATIATSKKTRKVIKSISTGGKIIN